MAGYDPQAGGARPRPEADDPSPVDELLGEAVPEELDAPTAAVTDDPPRSAPVPADDPAIAEYRNYGLAALLALVLLYLLRKRR